MTTSLVSWGLLLLSGAIIWISTGKCLPRRFDRFILASASALLSFVSAIAASLWITDRLRLIVIVPVVLAIIAVIAKALPIGRTKEAFDNRHTWHDYVVVIVIITIMMLSFSRQFQYQSFWGDDGVYLMAAQHYSRGGTVTFRYDTSAFQIGKQGEKLGPINGMNPSLHGDGTYQFHALPGWPATMALLGMPDRGAALLSLLFGLVVGMFFSATRRFSGSPTAALAGSMLLACLPLAWFLALYPTAEMLLLSIVLATCVLAIHTQRLSIAVFLGMFAYGVVHIGAILLAPLLGMILLVVGFFVTDSNKKKLIAIGFSASIACILVGFYASHVSAKYSSDIYHSLFNDMTEVQWIIRLIPFVGGLLPLILLIKRRWIQKASDVLTDWVLEYDRTLAYIFVMLVATVAVIEAYLLGWTRHYYPNHFSPYNSWSSRVAYVDMGLKSVMHMSLLSLAGASAIIGFMAFVLLPSKWSSEKKSNGPTKLLWLACLYAVIVFGIVHPDIPNNYYASRYFFPVATPLLLSLAVAWLSTWQNMSWQVPAVCLVSLGYVGALLGQGFFLGDQRLIKEVFWKLRGDSYAYFYGSRWLRYFVEPRLAKLHSSDSSSSLTEHAGMHAPIKLLTDHQVLGGAAYCFQFIQRRIPWQIGYLLHPDMVDHRVCVVSPSRGGELTLGTNDWLIGGKMHLVVAKPIDTSHVYVELDSLGWWAEKPPYRDKLHAMQINLTICGMKFNEISRSPTMVLFKGTMNIPYCKGQLTTSTFVPSRLGLGSDNRKLGIDLYAIRIYGDDRLH